LLPALQKTKFENKLLKKQNLFSVLELKTGFQVFD